jgi:hypothetical protein
MVVGAGCLRFEHMLGRYPTILNRPWWRAWQAASETGQEGHGRYA